MKFLQKNSQVQPFWPQQEWRSLGMAESRTSRRETEDTDQIGNDR